MHPDTDFSNKVMPILSPIANDIFERIAAGAGRLAHRGKRCASGSAR